MAISGRTIARLARPFEGGSGPGHGTIERIWASADASEYLGDGNKMERVLRGLQALRDGQRAKGGQPSLPADDDKLREVVVELAELLLATGQVEEKDIAEALGEDAPAADPTPVAASKGSSPTRASAAAAERGSASPEQVEDPSRVMVVHGQDSEAARAMFDWLRAIGLRPSEWNQLVKASGVASPFIGEVLNEAFRRVQAVVVLFTPDEHVKLRDDLSGGPWRLQARPNVLFEAGMAFATHAERTVLTVLGDQDLPTDLAGRHYVRLGSPQAHRDLGQRLEGAGCPVDLSGGDWLDTARFPDRRALPPAP